MRGAFKAIVFLAVLAVWVPAGAELVRATRPDGSPGPYVLLPDDPVGPASVGVIINTADPLSRRIGAYFVNRRNIPGPNIVEISFTPGESIMSVEEFNLLKAVVDEQVPNTVQFLVITWAAPYRVDCMSITTAFAAGYDKAFCAEGCQATRSSPYFNSNSRRPFTDHGWRPTIALAALDLEEAMALIERGVRSDGSSPTGTGYLVETSDKHRNGRAALFPPLIERLSRYFELKHVRTNALKDVSDVLLYMTGARHVDNLDTIGFQPGAIADHLTSAGGRLSDSKQMSSLAWLEAGATGSYGTVVEPCNFLSKFPHPGVVIARYGSGETLIEAYWKSVARPGQGIFVGEPLARPFGGSTAQVADGELIIESRRLGAGTFRVERAQSPVGPYRALPGAAVHDGRTLSFRIPRASAHEYYRVSKYEPVSQSLTNRQTADETILASAKK